MEENGLLLIYSVQTGASSVILPEDVLQISCIPLPIFLPSAQTSHSRWPPLPELGSVGSFFLLKREFFLLPTVAKHLLAGDCHNAGVL